MAENNKPYFLSLSLSLSISRFLLISVFLFLSPSLMIVCYLAFSGERSYFLDCTVFFVSSQNRHLMGVYKLLLMAWLNATSEHHLSYPLINFYGLVKQFQKLHTSRFPESHSLSFITGFPKMSATYALIQHVHKHTLEPSPSINYFYFLLNSTLN